MTAATVRTWPKPSESRLRAISSRRHAGGMSEMTIAVAIWDGVEELDVVGPYEVLASWGAQSNGNAVHVYTVAERADEVRCAHGLRLLPDRTWSDVGEIDVLVLPGGNARPQAEDERVLGRVRELGENGTL